MARQIGIASGLRRRKSEDPKKTQTGSTFTTICLEDNHLTSFHSFAQNQIEPFTSHKADAELKRAQAIQSRFTSHTTFW